MVRANRVPMRMSPPADRLVLLVDDDLALLAGMQAWLRDNQSGFAVLSTGDSAQALQLFRRHKPDLVVSDVRMPGMDGLELLLACRRSSPETRFILTSGFGPPAADEVWLDGVRFLGKPVDLPQLEEIISLTLGEKLEAPEAGHLEGISVAGFVQLLAMERLTVCLDIQAADGTSGALYFQDGELRHARAGEQNGEPAALRLLGQTRVDMLLRRGEAAPRTTVRRPLNFLLMEAARLSDEGRAAGSGSTG
jgi:CheY-like chemotaxis protein